MDNKKTFTYLDYLNVYYKLGLPAELKSQRNSLFLGLLQKANTLRRNGLFPKDFNLTNHEAQILSGILNFQTFNRVRESLSTFKTNNNWLANYQKPPHSSLCGRYALNLAFLESHYQTDVKNDTQNDSQIYTQTDTQTGSQSDNLLRKEKNRKEKTTTGGSSFENEGEPKDNHPVTTMVRRLQGAILTKYSHQVTVEPSYGSCRKAIEEVGGDINRLLEAIDRMPLTLKSAEPDGIPGTVVKWAKNPTWGIPRTNGTEIKTDAELMDRERMSSLYMTLTRPSGMSHEEAIKLTIELAKLYKKPKIDFINYYKVIWDDFKPEWQEQVINAVKSVVEGW